jgi:rubrerythrin
MAVLGNPFAGNTARQMSAQELVQALRVDIAGELEAIIVYEAHIAATTDERAKKVLSHIADEEKNAYRRARTVELCSLPSRSGTRRQRPPRNK